MKKGEYLYCIGISFDLITTYIGINYYGLIESNKIGLNSVYLTNIALIVIMLSLTKLKRSKKTNNIVFILLFIAFIQRMIIGISNINLMIQK